MSTVSEYRRDGSIRIDEDWDIYFTPDDRVVVRCDRFGSPELSDQQLQQAIEWLLDTAEARGLTLGYEVRFRNP